MILRPDALMEFAIQLCHTCKVMIHKDLLKFHLMDSNPFD